MVDIKGRKSHQILQQAIQVLRNLDHRGAAGGEINTGDGAGVLIQIPCAFFEGSGPQGAASPCPNPASTAAGWSSCPATASGAGRVEERFEQVVRSEGQALPRLAHGPDQQCHPRRHRQGEQTVRIAAQVFIGPESRASGRPGLRAQTRTSSASQGLQRDPHLDRSTRAEY